MPLTVLLDVDLTLRMLHFNDDGTRYRELNQALVDELKASGVKEVYFLTNMDLSDSDPNIRSQQNDKERMTRKILIDELQLQGIKVKAVLTVADIAYGKGPGAAYKDLYTAAYATKKKEEHQVYQQRWHDYSSKPYEAVAMKPKGDEMAGFQKEEAFRYFLAHMSDEELGTLIYADDDMSCLQKVDAIAQARHLPMKLIPVKPEDYQTEEERAKYKLLLQDAHPFGTVLAHYRTFVGSYFFSTHNATGLVTAEGFIKEINRLTDPEARAAKIIGFLAHGEHSPHDLHSFRTILLSALLEKDIRQDEQLEEVAHNYSTYLDAYRQKISATAIASTSVSEGDVIDRASLSQEIPDSPKI
ncbi:hypothetical protein ACD661_03405 [Legionella lytica]|uniref:Dot/Icm T4SS effector n=1 Tax=Legionella lytica TaxID=96232 RepID=A0ABW8D5W5_9GAMM